MRPLDFAAGAAFQRCLEGLDVPLVFVAGAECRFRGDFWISWQEQHLFERFSEGLDVVTRWLAFVFVAGARF